MLGAEQSVQRHYGRAGGDTGRLIEHPRFFTEKRDALQAAIARFKSANSRKEGLADALIAEIAAHAGCTATMTFDKAAVRAAGMTLLV